MPEDHRKRATKREGREGSRTPYYLLQKTQGGMCGVDGLAEWDGADRSNLILNSRAAPSSDRYRTWVSVDIRPTFTQNFMGKNFKRYVLQVDKSRFGPKKLKERIQAVGG